jgi:hypothetical protein
MRLLVGLQCIEEFSGEERSKTLWAEVVHQIVALPHDQAREEKLAVVAGMGKCYRFLPLAYVRVC